MGPPRYADVGLALDFYKSCWDRFSGKVCSQMLSTTTAIDTDGVLFRRSRDPGSWDAQR